MLLGGLLTATDCLKEVLHSSQRQRNFSLAALSFKAAAALSGVSRVLQAEQPDEVVQGGPDAKNGDESVAESADELTDDDGELEGSKKSSGCGESSDSGHQHQEYEFTKWEERVLEVRSQSRNVSQQAFLLRRPTRGQH